MLSEWRNKFLIDVKDKYLEDSLKSKDDVKKLVQSEFNNLADQVKNLSKVYEKNGKIRYQIYDRILEVEFADDTIKFYKLPLGSFDQIERTDQIELIREFVHNGSVFVIKNDIPGQSDRFINNKQIDEILEKVFFNGSALRY